jgi:hypothetical protein
MVILKGCIFKPFHMTLQTRRKERVKLISQSYTGTNPKNKQTSLDRANGQLAPLDIALAAHHW